MDRATCWSITINNPTDSDMKCVLPAGWKISGQIEKGEEGTEHYQAMLQTPQIRFSAVKKVFPRAHIEIARSKVALQQYVSKEDTRIATVPPRESNIPTLWDYQHTIAKRWDWDEYECFKEQDENKLAKEQDGEQALRYVDDLVARDIRKGVCGVEFIAINPMWRSAWKKFYASMVAREVFAEAQRSLEEYSRQSEDRQTNHVVYPPGSEDSTPPAEKESPHIL